MGGITEIATAAPGYSSVLPNTMRAAGRDAASSTATRTAQFGKCHEVPVWETSPSGPFDAWPTGGGGFEYFYGFIGGETNQWYPALYEGTTPVEPPKTPEEGYHFIEDMTDKAIDWIAPAEGADAGQAVLHLLRARRDPRPAPRAEGVGRQVQGQVRPGLGQAARGDVRPPEEARRHPRRLPSSPPRPEEIPAWDDDAGGLEAGAAPREMEVYAGFLEYTDHHVGRLLDALEELGHPRRHAHLLHHRRQRRLGRGHAQRHLQRDDQLQRRGRARDARVPASSGSTSSAGPSPTTTTPSAGRTR